eukprot:6472683-Amphidinium_carterae.1
MAGGTSCSWAWTLRRGGAELAFGAGLLFVQRYPASSVYLVEVEAVRQALACTAGAVRVILDNQAVITTWQKSERKDGIVSWLKLRIGWRYGFCSPRAQCIGAQDQETIVPIALRKQLQQPHVQCWLHQVKQEIQLIGEVSEEIAQMEWDYLWPDLEPLQGRMEDMTTKQRLPCVTQSWTPPRWMTTSTDEALLRKYPDIEEHLWIKAKVQRQREDTQESQAQW